MIRSAKAGEGSTGVWDTVIYGLYNKDDTVSLIGGRPSVREVPSSIVGDIIYLFRLLSFLCSVNLPYIPLKRSTDRKRGGGGGAGAGG